MMNFAEPPPTPSDRLVPHGDPLQLAVAAYLARFKGSSRYHTASDLRCYLSWCSQHRLDPLAARRPHLELYIRWMQELRRFKPSTVSRRFSVTAGFYRTCVIDGLLEHSPAEHVRRPSVPAESPTLGFTHLQFEALLTAARESPSPCDFALVAMLGLPGLRIFEATAADITDLGEEHGHRVLRVRGKGTKGVLVRCRQRPRGPSTGRSAPGLVGSGRSALRVPGGEEFSFLFFAQAGAQIWLPAVLVPGQGIGHGLGQGPAAKAGCDCFGRIIGVRPRALGFPHREPLLGLLARSLQKSLGYPGERSIGRCRVPGRFEHVTHDDPLAGPSHPEHSAVRGLYPAQHEGRKVADVDDLQRCIRGARSRHFSSACRTPQVEGEPVGGIMRPGNVAGTDDQAPVSER